MFNKIKKAVKTGLKLAVVAVALMNAPEVEAAIPTSMTYASQFDEAQLNYANCGPTVLKMVAQDESLTYTQIRQAMGNKTPQVYVSEFETALKKFDVDYKKQKFTSVQSLAKAVQGDAVAVAVLDMSKISVVNSTTGIGKNAASLNTGHFVIINDYVVKNGVPCFEVIDPYNPKIGANYIYATESFFSADEINTSMKTFSDNLFVVSLEDMGAVVTAILETILN